MITLTATLIALTIIALTMITTAATTDTRREHQRNTLRIALATAPRTIEPAGWTNLH